MKNLSLQRFHFNNSSTANNNTSFIIFLLFLSAFVHPTATQSTAAATNTVSPEKRYRFESGTTINHSMSIVLVALVCTFFFLGFLAVYIRHCTADPSLVQANNNTHVATTQIISTGLDKELIEKFPILVYSQVRGLKIDKVQLECAVCLNEFRDYESLRLLTNCDHVFHPECIDVWLGSHVTCPVCRTVLKPETDHEFKGRVVDVDVDVVVVDVEPLPVLNVSNPQSLMTSEGHDQIPINILNPRAENRSPRSISNMNGKFPRSHSTGHSLVRIKGELDKYTLRLPEEVRKQIEITGASSRDIMIDPKVKG